MSKATSVKKEVSAKLIACATKTFEELSQSKSTKKTTKLIRRSAKRLVKTLNGLLKKAEKKKAKQAKLMARKKAKEAKTWSKNNKVVRVKTTRTAKKVPVN